MSEFVAVASSYLRPVLACRDSAKVVSVGAGHAYCRLDRSGRLFALEAERGPGLPISVVVPAAALPQSECVSRASLPRLDQRVRVGPSWVQTHNAASTITSWRDQRLVLEPGSVSGLRRMASRLRTELHARPAPAEMAPLPDRATAFREALMSGDAAAVRNSTRRLIGLGSGSTPAGDDIVCGAKSVVWSLARTNSAAGLNGAAGRLHGLLTSAVDAGYLVSNTTALSAELLGCSAAGHVIGRFQKVLTAAESDTDLASAMDKLCLVGSSSGYYLAVGAKIALKSLATQLI